MNFEQIITKVGSLLTKGCMTVFVGMVAFIALLWGIGTCMGVGEDGQGTDSIAAKKKTTTNEKRGQSSTPATFEIEEGSYQTMETPTVDVPFDESSTIVFGE